MTHTITLNGGLKDVVLPNQLRYQGGATVVLSDQQYSQLSATWRSANLASDAASTDYSKLSLLAAPSGAKAESFSRLTGSGYVPSTFVSGTVYASLFPMPGGLPVSQMGIMIGSAAATVTHAWIGLVDSGLVVRAISADTPGASQLTAGFDAVPMAMTGLYTVPASGDYYAIACIVAGTMPQIAGNSMVTSPTTTAPIVCGSSQTGQTTPPALGSTIPALTGASGFHFYAYTS